MRGPFSLEKIHLSTGMHVSFDGRCYELLLDEPLGRGTMRTFVVSPWFLASTVDFEVERCPNLLPPQDGDAGRLLDDTWFSMNFCMEGRCEVLVPSEGFAVVGAGDFCVGHARTQPDEFRYPSGRYRGVELFVSTRVLRGPLLRGVGRDGDSAGCVGGRAGYDGGVLGGLGAERRDGAHRRRCRAFGRRALQDRPHGTSVRPVHAGFLRSAPTDVPHAGADGHGVRRARRGGARARRAPRRACPRPPLRRGGRPR